jgi:hypothetical protein
MLLFLSKGWKPDPTAKDIWVISALESASVPRGEKILKSHPTDSSPPRISSL